MDGGAGDGAAPATEPQQGMGELSLEDLGIDLSDVPGEQPVLRPLDPTPPPASFTAPAGAPVLQPSVDPAHQLPGQQPPAGTASTSPPAGEVQYRNHADLLLNQVLGINQETLTIDGQEYNIGELPAELEAQVIVETIEDYNHALAERDQLIAQYEQQLQQGGASNDVEAAVLTALRQGNTQQLLEVIRHNDPVAQLEALSPEQLVRQNLREQNPSWTDADVNDEVAGMAPSAIDRRARSIMDQVRAQQPSLDYLRQVGGGGGQEADSFHEDVAAIGQYAQQLRGFRAGEYELPLQPAHVDYLLQQTTVENPTSGMTAFMERASSPEGVMEYEFWRTYGPQLYSSLQQQVQQAYAAGQNAVKLGYPAQPVLGAPSPTGNAGDLDWDAMARPTSIGHQPN
jgi:hypothetical protein